MGTVALVSGLLREAFQMNRCHRALNGSDRYLMRKLNVVFLVILLISFTQCWLFSKLKLYEEEDWHCILSKKKFWVERDLNPGPNSSDASSLWTELYRHLLQISMLFWLIQKLMIILKLFLSQLFKNRRWRFFKEWVSLSRSIF